MRVIAALFVEKPSLNYWWKKILMLYTLIVKPHDTTLEFDLIFMFIFASMAVSDNIAFFFHFVN